MSIKYSDFQAPNGKFFEQNDIDYLMNNGYTLKDALEELSKIDKYRKKKKSKDGEKTCVNHSGGQEKTVPLLCFQDCAHHKTEKTKQDVIQQRLMDKQIKIAAEPTGEQKPDQIRKEQADRRRAGKTAIAKIDTE